MGTGWWLALGAVALIALVAAYVDGTRRVRRRPPPPGRRDGTPPRRD